MACKVQRNTYVIQKRRIRFFRVLMIPVGVLVAFIGWSLCWVGQAEEKLKPKLHNQTEKLTFAVLLPHPKLSIRNHGYATETPENSNI